MAIDVARANSLFLNASQLADPAERAAYLEGECGGDAALRERIEALLRAQGAGLLPAAHGAETSADADGGAAQQAATGEYTPEPAAARRGLAGTTDYRPPVRPGLVIAGRYVLGEKIGEGGMGEVWAAQQTEPVQRQVALKLIKTGMDSSAVLARFEVERQALAIMDHPHIARVLDGGMTPSGQPFFAMELVRGLALHKFCDRAQWTLRERLELFVPICQAVQHAHHKGIVHRDLKPANILVTLVDAKPTPKIIDFGVAKATAGRLAGASVNTQWGAVVGTLEYMAPEQAGPSGEDVDTRADIYSLGVILYELLTGLRPIDASRLREAALTEMIRIVREEEPSRPSARLSADGSLPSLAALRQTEPKRLMALLRGELDWVVMKCLEKQRERRYETANALGRDIQRYLADEVVEARPPSAAYRLQKFVRRNKGRVLAAAALLLALLGGTIGTALGLVEATQQRGLAEGNLKKADENFRLAQHNLKKSDENFRLAQQNLETSEENYRLARGAVDRYLTQVGDNRLLNEPYMDLLRLELLGSAREFYQTFAERRRGDPAATQDLARAHLQLADIAWRLDRHDDALRELESSRDVLLAAGPAARAQAEFIQSGIRLCSYQMQLARFDVALGTANRTLHDAETGLKARPSDPELENLLARVLERRGAILRQKNQAAGAIADFERAADILERLVQRHPDAWDHARDLANLCVHRGQLAYEAQDDDGAERWHRKALAIRRARAAADGTSEAAQAGLAVALSNVAAALRRQNRHAEAIALMAEAVGTYRTLVRDHPAVASYRSDLASCLSNLSVIYKTSGAPEKADPLNQEAIDLLTALARAYPTVVSYALALGTSQGNEGNGRLAAKKWDEAILWFDRSSATLLALQQNSNDPRVRSVLRNNHWGRADAFMAQGQFPAAIAGYDRAIAVAEERFRPELRLARALALAKSGDYRAARAAVDAETENPAAGKVVWFDASKVLAAAATAAKGDPGAAGELSARAVAALRRAFELGYFDGAPARWELQSRDFAALGDRADFIQLLAELKKKFPPK